jgi:hypothetical protein
MTPIGSSSAPSSRQHGVMASIPLPRRESTFSDVIDLRPWDVPATPVSPADLDLVLTWLDQPTS